MAIDISSTRNGTSNQLGECTGLAARCNITILQRVLAYDGLDGSENLTRPLVLER